MWLILAMLAVYVVANALSNRIYAEVNDSRPLQQWMALRLRPTVGLISLIKQHRTRYPDRPFLRIAYVVAMILELAMVCVCIWYVVR